VQGTGESRPFTPDELSAILALSKTGIEQVLETARAKMAEPLK
jgi:ribonuclease PH